MRENLRETSRSLYATQEGWRVKSHFLIGGQKGFHFMGLFEGGADLFSAKSRVKQISVSSGLNLGLWNLRLLSNDYHLIALIIISSNSRIRLLVFNRNHPSALFSYLHRRVLLLEHLTCEANISLQGLTPLPNRLADVVTKASCSFVAILGSLI